MLKNIFVRIFFVFVLLAPIKTCTMEDNHARGVKRKHTQPESPVALWERKKPVWRRKGEMWKCENHINKQGKLCAKSFSSHQEYTNHINAHRYKLGLISAPYSCDLCGHGTVTKTNMYSHMREQHADHFGQDTSIATLRKYITRTHLNPEHEGNSGRYSTGPEQGLEEEEEELLDGGIVSGYPLPGHPFLAKAVVHGNNSDNNIGAFEQEEGDLSDSGDTTESVDFAADEGDDSDGSATEEELLEEGVVPGYPLHGYQMDALILVEHGSSPCAPEENPEGEDQDSDSDSQSCSPRSKVLQEYTITPHVRRKYTKSKNGTIWTCEKLNLEGNTCGKQFKKHADFLKHSNAKTKHLNGTIDFGYICTLCYKYKAAAVNNVYSHIKNLHPEYQYKTAQQLKKFVGILTHHTAGAPGIRLQKEGTWKCTRQNCTKSYRSQRNLHYHLEYGH